MTLFIDLRATPSGGICAAEASIWEDGTRLLTTQDFVSRSSGRDLVLATHGFNVDRASGIAKLTAWSQLLEIPASDLFVGVLWAGDSQLLGAFSYPMEGSEAIQSGRLLAQFLNQSAGQAASVSFASHSLGARTFLEALNGTTGNARRLTFMAAAIEDDCLSNEYAHAASKAAEIYVLASRSDKVLQLAFPLGNLFGEIDMRGNPYYAAALGRNGPAMPIPIAQRGGAWQIPDSWKYGHGDYLPSGTVDAPFPLPINLPSQIASAPGDPDANAWKPSWSAAAVSTQLT